MRIIEKAWFERRNLIHIVDLLDENMVKEYKDWIFEYNFDEAKRLYFDYVRAFDPVFVDVYTDTDLSSVPVKGFKKAYTYPSGVRYIKE